MITVHDRSDFLKALKPFLPQYPLGVELGVLYGDFSKMILDIINPSSLILIDPYQANDKRYGAEMNNMPTAYSTEEDYQNLRKRFKNELFLTKVFIIRKSSFEIVDYFHDNVYDFSYHDASHLYPDIKRDLTQWLPKLKHNGIVCGHDYIDLPGFGVTQAVDEFITEHDLEMILFNDNGGDWALKRKQ